MRHYIAMGFQNTVDFELEWDPDIFHSLIDSYQIHESEICCDVQIRSERDIIIALLGYMRSGTGGERFTSSDSIVRSFADRFSYEITLGGTPVRAAESMGRLGYRCCLHACSFNRYFRDLVSPTVDWITSVPDEGDAFHPHVIFQFPKGAHIKGNDINFTVPRSNRAIFDYDLPSKRLMINEDFRAMIKDSKVFLAAGYNVIEDKEVLKRRLNTTIQIMEELSPECITFYEDGGHEDISIGLLTIQTLAPHLDMLSLNEDELQGYVQHSVDITNAEEVAAAVKEMYEQAKVPLLICHSAYWALAYGVQPRNVQKALEGGIWMASTRFRIGSRFTEQDYEDTKAIPARHSSIGFCRRLTSLLGEERLLCLPGLDLDHVGRPVTIGLGDAFIGGFLPGLLSEEEKKYIRTDRSAGKYQ